MLLLSELVGQNMVDANGRVLGRVVDVTACLDRENGPTLIRRILVRRRKGTCRLVPLAAFTSLTRTDVRLGADTAEYGITSIDAALQADEILLVRDVLDTQIIDIAGQRLARVADVVLARGSDGRLEVVGVEVGFGAVLRRIGLGRLVGRTRGDLVPWTALHLTSERGHTMQLATPRSAIHLLDARGLAMLVARLDTDSAAETLAAQGPETAAHVIEASHPEFSERMLRAMQATDAAEVVAAMPAHRATHWRSVLADHSKPRRRPLLRSHIWPRRRREIERAGP